MRTPLLIRAYLGGLEDFPGDEAGEARLRASERDYTARMHRRIKDRIKQIQIGYQYPRRGSFTTLVNHLKKLRLVEETERQEDPQERGAGVLGVPGGFMPRTWVRLTPGSLSRPEWADPIGHIALVYPNIRGPAREFPQAPRPPAPRPRTPGIPGVIIPGGITLEALERRRAAFASSSRLLPLPAAWRPLKGSKN